MMPLCVFLVAAGAFPLVGPAAEPAAKPSIEALPTALTLPLGLPAGTKPLELVRLRGSGKSQAFLTAKSEVTQAQHEAVVGRSPSEFKSGHDYPVENVNWDEAKAFCAKLTSLLTGPLKGKATFRLPTDAEWSLAVGLAVEQGSSPNEKDFRIKEAFPWGTQWPPPRRAGNYYDQAARKKHQEDGFIAGYDDGFADTSPVGRFKPNPLAFYDLGGNVWKWCEDWYDEKRATRVSRGASWRMGARDWLLSSCRLDGSPEARGDYVGFRVVLALAATKSKAERGKLHVCGE